MGCKQHVTPVRNAPGTGGNRISKSSLAKGMKVKTYTKRNKGHWRKREKIARRNERKGSLNQLFTSMHSLLKPKAL